METVLNILIHITFYTGLFIFGGLFGGFLGVVVSRSVFKESVKSMIFGRSKCGTCKKEIRLYDILPVMSFLWLSGKCRFCKQKLSKFYLMIELGVVFDFLILYYFSFFHFFENILSTGKVDTSLIHDYWYLFVLVFFILLVIHYFSFTSLIKKGIFKVK